MYERTPSNNQKFFPCTFWALEVFLEGKDFYRGTEGYFRGFIFRKNIRIFQNFGIFQKFLGFFSFYFQIEINVADMLSSEMRI